jgi:hypothetical protein
METPDLLIALLIGFALGAVFGTFVLARFTQNSHSNGELEKHLHDKQEEIKNYQQEVREHFTETAGLLRGLAENYRDVHNHLAQGAEELCPDPSADSIIKKLPEVGTIELNNMPDSVSAPLDYAPKATPFDKSVLGEDYQLEKVSLNEAVSEQDVADLVASQSPEK